MLELRIHGYGGEGIVTLAELVAAAAMKTGKQVQTLPNFGVERRGAPVKALLRISDEEIWVHSQSYQPDMLLLHNAKLLDSAISQGIKENGRIVLNYHQDLPCAYPLKHINATEIAVQEGLVADGVPYINLPLCGAISAELHIPVEAVVEAVQQRWPGKVGKRNAEVAAIAYGVMQGGAPNGK